MDNDKSAEPTDQPSTGDTPPANIETPTTPTQDAPADALSRTPDELTEEREAGKTASGTRDTEPGEKKVSPLRRFLRRFNVYFLLFLLIVAIAAVITAVNYINSQKEPVEPSIATQDLDQETLKELANTDASVGNTNQTLTIQGNAIIEGQSLLRGNLNVAGNFQTAGSLQGAGLTVAGTANLGQAQINSLQVAQNTAIQGTTTLRDLTVSGTTSFSGPVQASQLTVTRLIMAGNASLEVRNHIGFTGPTPGRSINAGVLGRGGSASVNGSDTTGTVNINTGTGPSAGCFVRVTFNQAYSGRPHVIISPVGSGAGRTQHYVDRDQNGFSICTATPAPANQSFAFDYFVTS